MQRRRRFWIAWAALPLLLLIGDVVYWRYAAQQLDAGFAAWVATQRAAGWTFQAAPPALGGWPVAATLTTTGVTLSGGKADVPGGLRWTADRLVLRVALLHPQMLEIVAGGMQHLQVGNGPTIPFTSDRMRAELPLRIGAPPHAVHLRAENLRADISAGGETTELAIATLDARLDVHAAAARSEPALVVTIQAGTITLPSNLHWALGPRITSASLEGALDGPLSQAPDFTAGAMAWRDGGGAVQIRHFDLHWGPLDLSGTARLELDQQLQPAGAGTIRAVGYAETLDALAANGVLSPSAAVAAKAVLSLLAQPPEVGQQADVTAPLSLRHRTLSMREMPLVRLPELDWPAQ